MDKVRNRFFIATIIMAGIVGGMFFYPQEFDKAFKLFLLIAIIASGILVVFVMLEIAGEKECGSGCHGECCNK